MVQLKSPTLTAMLFRKLGFLWLAFLFACHPSGADSRKSSSTTSLVGVFPPVGRVDDDAGFFLELMSSRATRDKFNMHKGMATFDEPCRGEVGQVVDCYLDAEEQTLFALPFSLHYHVPRTMCSYVSVDPFYFVNRATKRTTSLTKFIDKTGAVGIDSDLNGLVDTTDFGCYTTGGVPECCVGDYPETTFVWDASTGRYGSPSTATVHRTLEKCLGGPATTSQSKNSLGVPLPTLKYVENRGASDVYLFDELSGHDVEPGWIANFFDSTQHSGSAPTAFNEDIDPGAAVEKIGNPYYTIACHDSAGETLAAIRVQIREWNTAAKFAARKTDAAGYDEVGSETDPWGQENKNDFLDWYDFEQGGITHPGFDYR